MLVKDFSGQDILRKLCRCTVECTGTVKCDPKCAALCDFVRADLHSQSENDIFAS